MSLNRIILQSSLIIWILLELFLFIEAKIHDSRTPPKTPLSPIELKNYLSKIMAHNATYRSCPAPNFPLMKEDCNLPTCQKDGDCSSQKQSCCFNGCIFTCVDRISPPPVIDWETEPENPPLRREGAEVLRCTTSPRTAPSVPVGCPKGYVCRIEDHGDAIDKRYNSGICVPDTTPHVPSESDDPKSAGLEEKTRKQTVYLPGGCVLSEAQFQSMREFMTRSYIKDCLCIDGSIECKVSA